VTWARFADTWPPDGALCFVSDGKHIAVAAFTPIRLIDGRVFEVWTPPDASGEDLSSVLGELETDGNVIFWQEITRPELPRHCKATKEAA
jgi:hypothetical protein